ncbi:telo2-interacting protein 2-like [Plakobranchus ocellatus]|uniref:Telo2-interacting protein 2-like n=1 Tax=Plakobranchus ocellatus TaxID=259542 RepID=A0AAV4AQH8_9GAST|nr:telo2-interacting protein 2-like [Plakobranchus ocellatus]
MRRGKLEHLVTTGKFEGKRSRGRQREKIMDGLATWFGPGKVSDILVAVKHRVGFVYTNFKMANYNKNDHSKVSKMFKLLETVVENRCFSERISILKQCTAVLKCFSENEIVILLMKPHDKRFCASIESVIETAIVPPFNSREYFSYSETDFEWYADIAEAVINFFIELLSICISCRSSLSKALELQQEHPDSESLETDGIEPQPERHVLNCEYFIWLDSVQMKIIVLIGAHLSSKLWSSVNTQQLCNFFLQQLLDLYNVSSVGELLCSETNLLKSSHENNPPKPKTNLSLFVKFMLYCKAPLRKEEWQRNPFLAEAFSWIVCNIQMPYLSDHIDQIMVVSLNFIDDHQVVNKMRGVSLMHHLLLNTSAEEMRWFNRAEVMYTSLKHQLYSKEWQLMEKLLPCLLCLLHVLEPSKNNFENIRHHEVFENLLQEAESENLIAMRRVYIFSLKDFTSQLGIGCTRHLSTIVRIINHYLEVEDSPEDKARKDALGLLHKVISIAWLRISHHLQSILQSLCKFLLDINASNLPRDEKSLQARSYMNGQVVDILKLLKQLVPDIQPCLQSLKDSDHLQDIKHIISMVV